MSEDKKKLMESLKETQLLEAEQLRWLKPLSDYYSAIGENMVVIHYPMGREEDAVAESFAEEFADKAEDFMAINYAGERYLTAMFGQDYSPTKYLRSVRKSLDSAIAVRSYASQLGIDLSELDD